VLLVVVLVERLALVSGIVLGMVLVTLSGVVWGIPLVASWDEVLVQGLV
jgi:hypothetical protein